MAMDPSSVNEIEQAIRKTGCEPHRMVSGAGHDAMILAEKVPAAMIFLRTPGGISHDPRNQCEVEDVAQSDRMRIASARSACFVDSHISTKGCAVHNLGQTRSSQQPNHLLLTADTFVRTHSAGHEGLLRRLCMRVRPWAQSSRNTRPSSRRAANWASTPAQRFVFVMEGGVTLEVGGKQNELGAGGYAYLPEGCRHRVWPRRRAALS